MTQEAVLEKAPVTTRQLVMYAGASGDYNPIHYDQDYARSAGLGGVIAHGMLVMAFAGQLATDWAGPERFVEALSGRFLAPVRPGDSVRLTAEVTPAGEGRWQLQIDGEVAGRQVFAGAAEVCTRG